MQGKGFLALKSETIGVKLHWVTSKLSKNRNFDIANNFFNRLGHLFWG